MRHGIVPKSLTERTFMRSEASVIRTVPSEPRQFRNRGASPPGEATLKLRPAPAPAGLARHPLLLSLLAVVVVSIAVSVALSRFVASQAIARDASASAYLVANSAVQRQAEGYFGAPHASTPEREQVNRFLTDLLWMPDVLRAQVFSREGVVLWSSHPIAVNEPAQENAQLARALKGELSISTNFLGWPYDTKPEHLSSPRFNKQFVEFYIPVWSADRARVIGVVEIYKSPVPLLGSIIEGIRVVWLYDSLGGLLIAGALAWILWHGRRNSERANRRLTSDAGFAAVEEVATVVSDTMRDPLEAIRASVKLLSIDAKMGKPNADIRRYAADILHDVDRLEAWSDSLRGHARAGAEDSAQVGLNALIGRLVGEIRAEAAERNVRLELREARGPDTVIAKPILLDQLLHLLIGNALDATPDGGDVAIEVRSEGRFALIIIKDCGVGMRPEQVARIFRSPVWSGTPGNGIGLPLMARALERMGGRVAVQSERGHGTRFEVSLPLAEGARG